MIKWKKVGEHVPTNQNKPFPGAPETPYVICIIWLANPSLIAGGFPSTIRFDTKNKVWLYKELSVDDRIWLSEPLIEITHYCDDINIPEESITGPDDNIRPGQTYTPQEKYNKG